MLATANARRGDRVRAGRAGALDRVPADADRVGRRRLARRPDRQAATGGGDPRVDAVRHRCDDIGVFLARLWLARVGAAHFEQLLLADHEIVGRPAATGDRPGPRRLPDTVFDKGGIEVDADRFTDYQPLVERPALLVGQFDQLGQLALERRRAGRHRAAARRAATAPPRSSPA